MLGELDSHRQKNTAHFSILGFPCGSVGKESTRNVGDLGSTPGLRRSPGEGSLLLESSFKNKVWTSGDLSNVR